MANPATYQAKCDCGHLILNIVGEPQVQLICHCTDCQTVSGQDSMGLAFFKPEHCQSNGKGSGIHMAGHSGAGKTYYRCPNCDSTVYGTVNVLNGAKGVDIKYLPELDFHPQAEVWTSEKVAGKNIPVSIKQSERMHPDIRKQLLSVFCGINDSFEKRNS
jgi:hypothetical protein